MSDTEVEYIDEEEVEHYENLSETGMEVVYDPASDSDDDDDDDRTNSDTDIDNEEGPIEGNEANLYERPEMLESEAIAYFSHNGPVCTVSVSPSETLVISGGEDDTANLWALKTGVLVFKESQEKFTETVSATGFSSDGVYVAAGTLDGQIAVWDTTTAERLHLLEGPSDITWLTWHPKGSLLLAGSEDGSAWLWSLPSGKCLQVFAGHGFPVNVGGFTPDGKWIITGSADGCSRIWDPKTGNVLWKHAPATGSGQSNGRYHTDAITSMVITSDSQLVVTGSDDHSIKLAHIHSSKMLGSLDGHQLPIESLAISEIQPNICVSGGADGLLNIWDLTMMKLRETCVKADCISKCTFMKNSPLVVTGSTDAVVRVWDSRTGKLAKEFFDHGSAIFDLACTSDLVVTASHDGTSCVFSMRS